MSDEFRTVLAEPTAREQFKAAMAHAKAMIDNGERVLVTVGPALEPISVQQRKFLHGVVLDQISEQVVMPDGSRYTVEVWKEYMRKRLLKPKWRVYRLPGQKKATPHRQNVSTETMGVKAYSKFIDDCIDLAVVEFNVVFHFIAEEREAVRYHARQAETA